MLEFIGIMVIVAMMSFMFIFFLIMGTSMLFVSMVDSAKSITNKIKIYRK